MAFPILVMPITTKITPAITVATQSPEKPYAPRMPETITINAPVGPPIWTFEPPKTEIINPAIIAVYKPCAGETPLAMAKAIARGRAKMPTLMPAPMSATRVEAL